MTPYEFAKRLHGREYLNEITKDEAREASDNDLVIVFGYSDDNAELRGAIHDEISCYNGGEFFATSIGLLENECDCEDCPYHFKELETAKKIKAVWDSGGYSWIYETDIPHATFDILESGEKYCRGIVFSLDDVK